MLGLADHSALLGLRGALDREVAIECQCVVAGTQESGPVLEDCCVENLAPNTLQWTLIGMTTRLPWNLVLLTRTLPD